MRYRANYTETGRFLLGPECRKVTTLAAAAWLSRARMTVSRDSGATAASGRLVHGVGGTRGRRVKVSVVFGGAAVPLQFGNKRTRATRFLTRAAP
jgi:hypothetical protein